MNLIWILTISIVIFQVIDFWTTEKVLARGNSVELNKPLAWLMDKIGVIPTLLIVKGGAAAAVIAGAYLGWWGNNVGLAVLVALFALYAVVVWNNLKAYRA